MAHIDINSKVIKSVNSDNLIELLSSMLDEELGRDVADIDADFVDDCVDALLALEQETNDFTALVPLVSSEKFLRKLTNDKHSFRSLNVFARTAIAAAIIAGSTLTANAAVEAVTGVNVLHEVGVKIQYQLESWGWFDGEGIDVVEGIDDDGDDEEITTAPKETTTKPTTTKPSTTQPTTKYEGIDIMKGVDDEGDDDEPTTQPTTKPSVTSPKPVTPTKPSQKNLDNISADVTSFKTDYIYGEEFDPSGLKLYANYDNDTTEQISLDDCYYTQLELGSNTADYKFTVMYKTCKLEFDITLRPDEYTRGSQIRSNSEYDYLLTSEGAYITAYKGDKTTLKLNKIDGNTVVAIGANMLSGSNVKTVVSTSATMIFEEAFKSCKSLEKISFPSVKYIGNSAFYGCDQLKNVTIGTNIDYLGNSAFASSGVEEFEIPESVTKIPSHLFDSCQSLKKIAFLGKVTEVGSSAFADCIALEEVTGCENITKISSYAFYNDEKLTFDTFPQGLEKVGDSAFYLCQSLDIGTMPHSIISIGKSSFAYCTKLTSVTIPDGMSVIPYEAFRGTGVKTIVIPEGVEIIEDYALRSIKANEIRLPESLKKIGREAINSPTIRKIYFGTSVEEIADDAFYLSRSTTFYVYDSTVPMQWAVEHGIKYTVIK